MNEITFTPEDLDFQRIASAHNGLSYFPEKRAEQQQSEYVYEMTALRDRLLGYADNSETRAAILADLTEYKQGWINRFWTWIDAKSRCHSAAIAGPANFPVRQQEKRHETERKRLSEFLEWRDRQVKRLERKYNPKLTAKAPIRSDDSDAIARLRHKIATLESSQETMKAANVIIRKKGQTEAEKVEALGALGFNPRMAYELMNPDFGRPGFTYQLSNNNNEIRRYKKRLEALEAEASAPNVDAEYDGVRVVDNLEAKRLQLFFDDKPDDATRAELKAHGFRWAPSIGAWQSYRNTRSRMFVARLVGENNSQVA